DSFACAVGPLTLYGQAGGGVVTVLGLAMSGGRSRPGAGAAAAVAASVSASVSAAAAAVVAAGLGEAMREFDLLLVDWCGGHLVEASDVADWPATAAGCASGE
ncbi:hypothetical protein AB0O00_39320, partial [Kitasatospora sp. NPDC093558]